MLRVKRTLPERDTASAFCFIDQLPLTDVGKVDYRALEETADEGFATYNRLVVEISDK